MKLPKKYYPEIACAAPKMVRPKFEHALLEITDKARVIATDGRIMVVIECEADASEGGLIPVDAFKRARNIGNKNTDAEIGLNSHCALKDQSTILRPIAKGDEGATKWRQVIPQIPASHSLRLSPIQLATLAKAIGSPDSVLIELIPDDNGGGILRVKAGPAAVGYMMLQKNPIP